MRQRINDKPIQRYKQDVADILAMNAGLDADREAQSPKSATERDESLAEGLSVQDILEAVAESCGAQAGDDYTIHNVMLLYLVPLVKVAWSEGRITRRERMLITEVARMYGITPGTPATAELQSWLSTEPTADFYDASFASLREVFALLPADKSHASRHDLLALCTRVAEASGGARDYAAGGSRICPEEVASIKHVTAELHRKPVDAAEAQQRIEQRIALRCAICVDDETLLSQLEEHGITPSVARAVYLAPLVQMAWAEGNVTRRERAIINNAARMRGIHPGSPTFDAIDGWLDRRPSDEFFDVTLRTVQAAFTALPTKLRGVDEWQLLMHCANIAAASNLTADFSDPESKMCEEEMRLLDILSARFRGANPR